MSLILPAVQSAREAARRTQCLSHAAKSRRPLPISRPAKGADCPILTKTGTTARVLVGYLDRGDITGSLNPALSYNTVSIKRAHLP